MKFNKNFLFTIIFLVAVAVWIGIIIFGRSSYADEKAHSRQINRFWKGNYHVLGDITTIPEYHLTMAVLNKPFHHTSTNQYRLVSLIICLFSVLAFYLLAKELKIENPLLATAQFIFLPVSFLYFPLLYTDIFSLLLVLLAFYFLVRSKTMLATVFSFLSILARQTNIVWVAFLYVFGYLKEYGLVFSVKNIKSWNRKAIEFPIIFIFFVIFVLFNHGIAIGDREAQQVGFHLGNIYFFLAVSGILFLPLLISSVRRINWRENKRRFFYGALISLLLGGTFLLTPHVLHEYNYKMAFLRNIFLQAAYHKYVVFYAGLIAFGGLTYFLMDFEEIAALFIFPFTAAYLIPSFLIEQRYYIVPLVIILLMRKREKVWAEYFLLGWFFVISILLVGWILETRLFV